MKYFFQIIILTCSIFNTYGQAPNAGTTPGDSLKVVEIISADRYSYQKVDSLTEILLLVGNVALKQETTLFYADSAIYNKNNKIVEAFGHVHINDNDSIDTYSDYLLYYVDTRLATLKDNVRLTDGKSNLFTNELEYDVNQKTGIYVNGGRVENAGSVLTSAMGIYYADVKDVYFKGDVKLVDPKYKLDADSLLYNTNSEIATFIAKTLIEDSAKRTILTSDGYYDLKNRNAFFGKRPVMHDGATTIIANDIVTDDVTGMSILTGNAVFRDSAQGVSVLANSMISNRNNGTLLATQKPLMILKQENDSLFIVADTLYSGRLSQLITQSDTVATSDNMALSNMAPATTNSRMARNLAPANTDSSVVRNIAPSHQSDSADRFFQAYRNVRIFSDSLQAVADSLFYSGKDSIFRLFRDPIIWASASQVTGDTIYLYTKNKKADELYVFENGLIINKTGDNIFNQMKGNRLNGYFKDGEIDHMRARGSAESIYYIKDNEEKLVGVNKASADIIDMRFKAKELNRVVFISEVKGTMFPIRQISEEDKKLRNFKWQEELRPRSRFDLFAN